MQRKDKYLIFINKYLISLLILIVVSFLLLTFRYNLDLKAINISDSLFIVNILVFIISLGINIGAGNVFRPIRYLFRKTFTRNKDNDFPKTYNDYLEDKKNKYEENKGNLPWYLTLSSLTLLIVAFIFAQLT